MVDSMMLVCAHALGPRDIPVVVESGKKHWCKQQSGGCAEGQCNCTPVEISQEEFLRQLDQAEELLGKEDPEV